MSTITPSMVTRSLRSYASTEKAKNQGRFFKTGKGEYGEGDKFMGVVVPDVRKVAKEYYKQVTLETIQQLIKSPYHEVRLCALIMLVYQYQRIKQPSLRGGTTNHSHLLKKDIYDFYVSHTKYINNWDLVDLTAPNIVGEYLLKKGAATEDTYFAQTTGFSRGVRRKQNTVSREATPNILIKLSQSKSLWERRIAILATFAFIRAGRHQEAFAIAELLLHDKHDLIHKAVGWMLREVGKRIGKGVLQTFLDKHAGTMPRTALRYAIEHLGKGERQYYMNK